MKTTEVYSWRVERQLKESLESAARDERTSVAGLLSRIVRDWLRGSYDITEDQGAQNRVREAATPYLGTVHGNDPLRAREASARVKQKIREKHASRRSD